MNDQAKPSLISYPNTRRTIEAVADRLLVQLINSSRSDGYLHVCATGGRLGTGLWPVLAAHPLALGVPWKRVHVWFSDERFVPPSDPERNDLPLVNEADKIGLPLDHIHRIPGPDKAEDVESAAQAYADELDRWDLIPNYNASNPSFVVSLLGIGEDGHVASLFPRRAQVWESLRPTVAVTGAPKPPPERVSLTRPMLAHCQQLWFMAAGEEKAPAVNAVFRGDHALGAPAAGLRGREQTIWIVDQALAARLLV